MVVRIFWSTEPTPLILANEASHVIASFVFLNSDLAFWAFSDISFRGPTCKFIIHHIFTFLASMPRLRANKAKLMSTFTSDKRLFFWAFYKMCTIRFWTPFSVRINIYSNIEHESLVLRIQLFTHRLLDICIFKLLVTTKRSTSNLTNRSFINFDFKISSNARFTKIMLTYELKWIRKRVFRVAN